jgi:SnoaL-like domain
VSPPEVTEPQGCPPDVRLALRELGDRYALHVDRLEIEEIGRLFVPDGVLKVSVAPGVPRPPEPRRGREEICKAMRSLDRYEATFHTTMGHVVEQYSASGSARGVTTCLAHHLTVGGDPAGEERAADYVMAIRYLDAYTLFEGAWHFAERELTVSWLADWPATHVRTRSGEWRPSAP